MSERRYNDPCPIARGLSLVGERWALLIVRELLLGPKRFTDLHRGLPTASQNVLSQRLHELHRDGVVGRRRLGPPTSATVYELTDWGRELEPVLEHLGRFGVRAPITSTADIGLDSLMLAVTSMFAPEAVGDLTTSCELRLDEDTFHATIADGRMDLARGAAERPEVVVGTDTDTLRRLTFGDDAERAELLASGRVRLEGDHRTLARLAEAFTAAPAPGI